MENHPPDRPKLDRAPFCNQGPAPPERHRLAADDRRRLERRGVILKLPASSGQEQHRQPPPVHHVGMLQFHHPLHREMELDAADPLLSLFQCPRHPGGLRLLPSACVAMWREAKNAAPWNRTCFCRGCEVGAGHAGEALPPATDEDDTGRACVFCGRSDQRLVGGLICITEFNRLAVLAAP